MNDRPSLAERSITSISWNVSTSLVQVVVGFARSMLLARLLAVETFGVYAWAGSVVGLSAVVANFGMGGAFVHRAPETQNEEETATVHFTLQLMFSLGWAVLLSVFAFVFARRQTRIALLVQTIASLCIQLVHTPRLILARRVVHRRLALLGSLNALLSTVVAVGLAWRGVALWALLSTDLVTALLNVTAFYIWRPVWRPRLTWSPHVMRYFLRFGSRNLLADALLRALDRVDDLWTGAYLGDSAMGYYSRAYTFATYPRRLLAGPTNQVAGGTYAELTGSRKRLSQAFFRINALLIRSGFLLAGLLALAAPEFIRIVLSAKWIPMLDAFRLMLVYTLLDPIKITVAALFVALGKPEQVLQARLAQLAVLTLGLLSLGPILGIAGVALAVDLMLVIGIGMLLWRSRLYVDFSVSKLFGAPTIGVLAGTVLARLAVALASVQGSDWCTAGVKAGVFAIVYGGILIVLERREITMLWDFVQHLYGTQGKRRWTQDITHRS